MTWDWTQISRTICEHATHMANDPQSKWVQFLVALLRSLSDLEEAWTAHSTAPPPPAIG